MVNYISVFAQGSASNEPPKIKYNPKQRFTSGISYVYKLTDSTDVQRILSDSSKINYKRNVIYYFSLKTLNPAEKGFSSLDVSVDSIQYHFNDGTTNIDFNSQDENLKNFNFEDVYFNVVPLGKDFTVTYSPYGDLAKLEGEKIKWFVDYVSDPDKGIKDSIRKFVNLDGVTVDRLQFLTDPRKINFPPDEIAKDTIFESPIRIMLDGMYFFDTVKAKFIGFNSNYYTFESTCSNFQLVDNPVKFYKIKNYLGQVDSIKGNGKFDVTLTSKGVIYRSTAQFNAVITASILRDKIIERVKSKYVWELVNQYRL